MKLTKQAKEHLLSQHRQLHDKRECDRIKAVLAYAEGYSYSEIAKLLLRDDETIRRHIEDYQSKHKLTTDNGGSDSFLSEAQAERLMSHLSEKTYVHVKDICAYVKSVFGKHYSISGMTKWLKAHDFRYKKPHPVPAKANKALQLEFMQYYEQLKLDTKAQEPIYFADGVHPSHQTKLAYGWIPRGVRKHIPTTARQTRMSLMGAICLENHQVVYRPSEKIDSSSIIAFLKALRKKHPQGNKLHIIWDNGSYHHSKAVKKALKKLNIQAHYLPPYSPNLNPIERLWKLMHEHVTYNKYYASFKEFTEAILHFFRHIGKKKKILRARITDKFQPFDMPNFAS